MSKKKFNRKAFWGEGAFFHKIKNLLHNCSPMVMLCIFQDHEDTPCDIDGGKGVECSTCGKRKHSDCMMLGENAEDYMCCMECWLKTKPMPMVAPLKKEVADDDLMKKAKKMLKDAKKMNREAKKRRNAEEENRNMLLLGRQEIKKMRERDEMRMREIFEMTNRVMAEDEEYFRSLERRQMLSLKRLRECDEDEPNPKRV